MSKFGGLRKHENTAHMKKTKKNWVALAARFHRGKQPECPVRCIRTRKLSNRIESNLKRAVENNIFILKLLCWSLLLLPVEQNTFREKASSWPIVWTFSTTVSALFRCAGEFRWWFQRHRSYCQECKWWWMPSVGFSAGEGRKGDNWSIEFLFVVFFLDCFLTGVSRLLLLFGD